jgi:hypothetical protein
LDPLATGFQEGRRRKIDWHAHLGSRRLDSDIQLIRKVLGQLGLSGITRDQPNVAGHLVRMQEVRQIPVTQFDPLAIVENVKGILVGVDEYIGISRLGCNVLGVGEEVIRQPHGLIGPNYLPLSRTDL